jgi:type IV pilus assembly protein PilN
MIEQRTNLLPHELRPRLELRPEHLSFGLVAVFAACAALISLVNQHEISSQRQRLARIRAEKVEISTRVESLTSRGETVAQRLWRSNAFQSIEDRKIYWVEMFRELATLTPKNVWLTDMSSNMSESDRGITLKGEAASQSKVAEFLKALENSTYFSKAIIKTSEKENDYKPSLYKFEINVPLEKAGKT